MRQEYRTGIERGLLVGGVGAVLAFFALWPQEPGTRELVSATVIAGVTPLAGFLGYGAADARKHGNADR